MGATSGKSEPTSSKEKNAKTKGKSQPSSNNLPAATAQTEEFIQQQPKANGSNRKPKEKPAANIVANPIVPASTQPTKPERQRSTSLSPALSSSSNPTPPPISSSSSPSSSHDSEFLPPTQHQFDILKQGASMAAEEEEIDRARDEAEDLGKCHRVKSTLLLYLTNTSTDVVENKGIVDSSSFAQSILENNISGNSHSFFSTGPLPAYTARSNGSTPSGCKSDSNL